MGLTDLNVYRYASELMSRAQIAAGAGKSFGGRRDLHEAFGYDTVLTPEKYRQRYRRGEVAGRVVDSMPMATWRGGGELIETEDPNIVTDFERAWLEFEVRVHAWSKFERADILAGLGRFAVILIGGPPADLSLPLEKVPDASPIAYLKPLGEELVTISDTDLVQNRLDARYGMPEFYQLSDNTKGTKVGQLTRVHHSRIVHIADGVLDGELYGKPRLERIWNRLDDLDKVAGGGSEAFFLRANRGTQFDIDPTVPLDASAIADLKAQVEDYKHGFSRVLRTRGVTINDLGSEVAQFDKSVDALIGLISAGTGIPQRILKGSERGSLASTQDEGNWEQRVSDRRKSFAGPFVVRELVNRLIDIGALPKPKEYDTRWPEAMELDDVARVELAKDMALVNHEAGETVILPNEIRDRALGWDPLDESELDPKVEVEDDLVEDDEDKERFARAETRKRSLAKSATLRSLRERLQRKRR